MKSVTEKFVSYIFLILLLTRYCAFAAFPVRTYIGIEQGLSNNFVRCIYQDKKGFMWFGTYDGLNRYDGYEFKIFRNNFRNDQSLINNWINTINEDNQENLWIGTRQGACVYQNLSGKFSRLYYLSQNEKTRPLNAVVKKIERDRTGNMFVGTAENGLLLYPKGRFTGNSIPLDNDANTTYDVTAIKADNNNNIWFFVAHKGLYMYEHTSRKAKLIIATLRSANCMETANGYLWVGANDGLFRYNMSCHNFDKVYNVANRKLNYNTVAGITAATNNELWIATNGGGVAILNTTTDDVQFLSATKEPNSLSGNAVLSIWIDKEARKWIASLRGGINVIDPNKEHFQNIASDHAGNNALVSNFILSFYEAPNNNLWIGTDGGGLSIWNRKMNSFTNYCHENGNPTSLSDNFITNIQSDFQKNLWITTYWGGVNRFNNGKFEHYKCIDPLHPDTTLDPIGPNLLVDADSNYWLSTQQYGLFKLNRQKKVFELFDHTLKDLYALTEDRNHVLWGGSTDHLVRIDRVGKKHASYFIGKPVNVIMEDLSGSCWVGTEGGGLILFDRRQGKIIDQYTTDEGLCSNSILTILEDGEGNLWMSTFNGIARFNPRSKTFRNYYQGDGLQSTQFNYHAAIKLRSGELAFGSIKGFSLFRPGQMMAPANSQPKIFLTRVKVANHPLEEDTTLSIKISSRHITQVTIPYNKALLSLEFAALEYSAPDKIQYAYYMQGADKGWIYCGDTRKVIYGHLAEGTYTFRVKNTNAAGQWNKEEAQIKITILPPWYRSWEAYSIYVFLIAAAVYLYLQYRARQTRLRYEVKIAKLNAEKERLEKEKSLAELATEKTALEKEKTEREREQSDREKERILDQKEKEINEKKISFFTNISHEFRTPLTLIINPVRELLEKNDYDRKDSEELNIVYQNARRMMSLVDQLLLFRKTESGLDVLTPAKLNLHDLAHEVYFCFVQQAKSQAISYTFHCNNTNLEIYADRQKLEIILYNLLSNAFKYTAASGNIKLIVDELAENVAISVGDDGAGIPSGTGEKLFEKFFTSNRTKTISRAGFGIGLFLVKQFTDQHKGTITYESEEGHGSIFTLKLQKGKTHFNTDVIISEAATASPMIVSLAEEVPSGADITNDDPLKELVSEKQTILVIDDDASIRQYLVRLLKNTYKIYEAENGETGLLMANKYLPDLVISDIHMEAMNGIELCRSIKTSEQLSHIPVILLTGATSDDLKLQGVEGGADDYVIKPFNNKLLVALVATLLRNRNTLQKYFYNEITLGNNDFKASPEYKELLDNCMTIVEKHLRDKDFSIQTLLNEMGMSHSSLLRKIKSVSGLPVNLFIRSIRLRKAAELFINTDYSIKETAYTVGIRDMKYFREQFHKLFGMNPSDYVKKYRKVHGKKYTVDKECIYPVQ